MHNPGFNDFTRVLQLCSFLTRHF
ncbi:hypothetical protein SBA6_660022 [Candidatus Sulfopaludibacter sp. SbA6]|nr:hypothetical protein SBA6_660022 [Candidatus Sulfopaludibacter sp. SbA6]